MTNGYSADAAKSYATQLFKTQKYSDQVMRSGTLNEKMTLTDALVQGVNVYDPNQWNDYIGLAVNTDQTITGWAPGYNDTMGGLITNIVGSASGTEYGRMWGAKNLTEKGITGSSLVNETNISDSDFKSYAEQAYTAFAKGDNQTNKQRQNITLENLANEIAVVEEFMGNFTDIIVTAIKGIGTILLTKVIGGAIGKGIGLLSGVGGATATSSSGGLFASLGAAGPIGLGIAAVGATVAAGVAIGNKMLTVAGQKQEEAKSDYAAQFGAKGYDSSTSDTLGKVQSITQFDKGNFLGVYRNNLSGDEKDELGIDRNFWLGTWDEIGDTKGKAWDNKQWYKYNNMAWLRSGFAMNVGGDILDDKTVLSATIMYAIALDQMGMLGTTKSTNPLLNWGANITSKEDIGNAIRAGIQEGYFTGWHDIHANMFMLTDEDSGPRDLNGKLYTQDITGDVLKQYGFSDKNEGDKYFMSHRYGLAEVPYDDYPALLHEGEAVLTASTANELRNLLDEYRTTNQQAVNYEAIIQNQTSELVSKMDQIIQTIQYGSATEQIERGDADKKVWNSMLKIRNTKSF